MTVAVAQNRQITFRVAGGPQPLILVPVSINGEASREFILDSGAGTTLLTPEFAGELDLQITGSKEGQTAGGKVPVQLTRVSSIGVGAASREDIDVAIVDLSKLSQAVAAPIHGDLGYNFLKHFRITINFRSNELRLDEPSRADYFGPLPIAEVPLRLPNPAKPLILIDASANDRGPFSFAIDTGTSTTAISTDLANMLQLATTPLPPVTTGGAQIEVAAARLDALRVAQAGQLDVDVIIADFLSILSDVVGTKLDGIIGYNFLRRYNVVIDYPGQLLSFFNQ